MIIYKGVKHNKYLSKVNIIEKKEEEAWNDYTVTLLALPQISSASWWSVLPTHQNFGNENLEIGNGNEGNFRLAFPGVHSLMATKQLDVD